MLTSPVDYIESMQMYEEEHLKSFVMKCPLPPSHHHAIPLSVSIVEHPCDQATNNLKVIYNVPEKPEDKKSFAVCSKGLSILEDQSIVIAEWFEILKAFGASKIDLYTFSIHPNIEKVSTKLDIFASNAV